VRNVRFNKNRLKKKGISLPKICIEIMGVFSRHLATPSCEETPESTSPSEDICTTVPGDLWSEKQSYGATSACA